MDLGKEFNSKIFIVECVCPEKIIKERLERRMKRKSVSDERWEIYLDQKRLFEPIEKDEGKHIVIDTSKKNDLEKIFI